MNKILTTILLGGVFSFPSIAQVVFGAMGSEWKYLFRSFPSPHPYELKISVVADSVINGDTLKYVFSHYNHKHGNDCKYGGITALKQKGDTIWFRNNLTNSTWQILYNFAVSAGQSWVTTISPPYQSPVNYIILVDSVTTRIVNGYSLKHLAVRYLGGQYGAESTSITERLGCNSFLFNYYFKRCSTDPPRFDQFLCYKDDELGTYQVGELPCNYVQIMSANTLQLDIQNLELFPNPASDKLFVNSGSLPPGETKITFFDVAGREIKTLFIEPSDKELDISDLPGGIYFVSLYAEEKRIGVRKLSVMR